MSLSPARPGAGSLQRQARGRWLAAGALALALLGQWSASRSAEAVDGPVLLLAAGMLFWLAVPAVPASTPAAAGESRPAVRPLNKGSVVLIGAALAAIEFIALVGAVSPLTWFPSIAAVVLGGVLWIALGRTLDRRGAPVPPSATRGTPKGWEWALAGTTLGAGLAIRLVGLDGLPAGFWFDEATTGIEARRILADPDFRPVFSQATVSGAGFIYLTAAMESLLGQTVLAVRLVPALAGAITPLAGWFLARMLFGPVAGVMTCGLLAFSRWDLTFSRLGMQGPLTPLLLLMVVIALVQAVRTRRWSWYAALGIVTGSLLWFYTANLAFLPLLTVGAVLAALRNHLRSPANWGGLGFAAAAAVAIAAPVLWFAMARSDEFTRRPESLLLVRDWFDPAAWRALAESTLKHLAMFNIAGDRNGRHNLPGVPMLDIITGGLLVLGVAAALRRWRELPALGLLVWAFGMLAPGILSVGFEAPQALRGIGALPAVILLAALGWWWTWRILFRDRVTAGALRGIGFTLAGVGLLNTGTYFGPQASDDAAWRAHSMGETLVGKRLAAQGEAERALVSEFFVNQPVIHFLAGREPQRYRTGDFPLAGDPRPAAVYLSPDEEGLYRQLQGHYPDAACDEHRNRPGARPVLLTCVIASADQERVRGLRVRYFGGEGPLGAPLLESTVPDGRIPGVPTPRPGRFRVVAEGSLLVPEYGAYRLVLEGPPGAQLYLDETPEIAAGGGSVTRPLAAGLHRLLVITETSNGSAPGRVLWQPPMRPLTEVPASALFQSPVEAAGLVARYRPGEGFSGEPRFEQVEPTPYRYFQIPPLDLPFSVEWTGSLLVKDAGTHRFLLEAATRGVLTIDGRDMLTTVDPGAEVTGSVNLTAGWHTVRVRQVAGAYARTFLRWQPPGAQEPAIIPPALLRPW